MFVITCLSREQKREHTIMHVRRQIKLNNNIIQTYSIFINPKNLKILRENIWSDEPVPATLKHNNKQYKITIMYRGSHIREFPKKSYEISFIKPAFFFSQSTIHLNAEYIDPSFMRNKLSLDFFHELGVLSPKAQYISLKINGKFEGIYLQLESVDKQFFQRRGLPAGAIFYAVDDDANFSLFSSIDNEYKKSLDLGYERKYGTKRDIEYLCHIIYKINTLKQNEFEKEIRNYIDVDKYLRWLIGVICTQNFDGFTHNYALYINSNTKVAEIIPWDYDATWGRDIYGDEMSYDFIPITGYNTLTARILNVPTYRNLYRNTLEKVLNEQFSVSNLQPKIEKLYETIRPYVLHDPYKQQEEIKRFHKEPKFILNYIEKRQKYLKENLRKLK